MEPSVFTKIISGEIPCHKVYEDDKFLAFLDIHPLTTGHTLLIPKQQIDSIWDLPDDLYTELWAKAKELSPLIHKTAQSKRVAIVVEGFGVPHAHIHLVPINSGADLKAKQNLEAEPDHEKLAKIAGEIRDKINESME